jgi:FixJ family two-component response regulator
LVLVVSGLLNKQVGGELGISEITVKAQRRQVLQKMKANSPFDLVRIAEKLRLECSRIPVKFVAGSGLHSVVPAN